MTDKNGSPQVLDLESAARIVESEKYGDWYRDPWGWPEGSPEFVSALDLESDFGVKKIRENGKTTHWLELAPFFHPMSVPKSLVGIRPAVVFDLQSKLIFTAAVDRISKRLHDQMPDWVYGWRMRNGEITKTADEWILYEESAQNISQSSYALQTDITSFFATIDVENLVSDIKDLAGESAAVQLIEQVLRAHDGLAGRRGLPQRCHASAYLAQIAVRPIDEAMSVAMLNGGIKSARRWMDDISAEGEEEHLYALLLDIQHRMRVAGLEVNTAKTHLTSGEKSAAMFSSEAIKEVKLGPLALRSEYGDEGDGEELDPAPLLRAEELLLSRPQYVPRRIGTVVLKGLRKHNLFERYPDWIAKAHLLPHLADSLSRYFAAASTAAAPPDVDLGRWFADVVGSPWGRLDWVSAQYALAFPTTELPNLVSEVLRKWLRESSNLQQVAVAGHRLATTDPMFARNEIRARIDQVADPLLLRTLGLSLLHAGEGRRTVSTILGRHPQTRLIRKYLESRQWSLPKVPKDFDDTVADSQVDV